MGLTAKLVNATPFDVAFPYDRGIKIRVPGDSEIELSVSQMDDFRAGKPGSEETRQTLEFYGLFLADSDRSYDVQALEALESALRSKTQKFQDFVERLKEAHMQHGNPIDEGTLEEQIKRTGNSVIRDQIEVISRRIATLKGVVEADPTRGIVKETLDPKRTCFVTQPPRQFPSVTALQMFLADHPDIAEKHAVMAEEMFGGEAENREV